VNSRKRSPDIAKRTKVRESCSVTTNSFIHSFIYLLQTTVGPYTYRTVENTQYKASNRIKKEKETHRDYPETKKLKSKKLKSKNTANYYTPARYLKQPH